MVDDVSCDSVSEVEPTQQTGRDTARTVAHSLCWRSAIWILLVTGPEQLSWQCAGFAVLHDAES